MESVEGGSESLAEPLDWIFVSNKLVPSCKAMYVVFWLQGIHLVLSLLQMMHTFCLIE